MRDRVFVPTAPPRVLGPVGTIWDPNLKPKQKKYEPVKPETPRGKLYLAAAHLLRALYPNAEGAYVPETRPTVVDFECRSGAGRKFLPPWAFYIGVESDGAERTRARHRGVFAVPYTDLQGNPSVPLHTDVALYFEMGKSTKDDEEGILIAMGRSLKDTGLAVVGGYLSEEELVSRLSKHFTWTRGVHLSRAVVAIGRGFKAP